jgi:hypothetical protein
MSKLSCTAAVLLLIGLASPAQGVEPSRKLKAAEINRSFSGMEFTDEVHWAYLFEPGGKLTSFSMGRKGSGSWRGQKDNLCWTRPPDAERCYEAWRSGPTVQLREPGFEIYEEGVLQKPTSRR